MGNAKVDVHAHYLPATYRESLEQAGHTQPDGMPAIPAWSAEDHGGYTGRLTVGHDLFTVEL